MVQMVSKDYSQISDFGYLVLVIYKKWLKKVKINNKYYKL